ncbi:TonB-dependent receptor [Flavobacteriaceae bacterium TP-CH-4]|uniref:TonB-dependent receptor n=1 Tax=Pelagihabitans pacificus TaxID=2696054 RepID=A0A967B398_9FLAO|nr:carboxypeptidase regulatory-like domain-containing protein [Pelagihabitans pacificus]NHF61211.1 TonB-dependent receptor [Pelagihabitans pacificus]
MRRFRYLILLLVCCPLGLIYSQTATITGVVLDENESPLGGVNITTENGGSFTDPDGFYVLQLVADTPTTVTFSHLGHENVVLENLILTTNETFEFNPVMKTNAIQVAGVTVSPTGEKEARGILSVSPEVVRKIPGANAGVENVLKLLPGVSSSNELSTQYSVRGGNYDENLVYVNDIEVYRPFLVRSAQQEGLSFVNSDLVQDVKFSPGGFQSKYGDKLSSVLDITYKNPVAFGASLDVSFLGAAASVETISEDKNFSGILGVRYRNNSLLVNSLETQSNFNPTFADLQSYFTYRFSNKFNLSFLGNISINDYQNEPINRQTTFGTLDAPEVLTVFYEGRENNRFDTALGAFKGTYVLNDEVTLKLISSIYHTTEEEYSDVIAQYELGEIDTNLGSDNLGEVNSSRGLATEFNRARNDLDALIFTMQHRGRYAKNQKVLEWGGKYTHEDIRDRIRESEFIDSVGFYIRPPSSEFVNNQPEEPFDAPIIAFDELNATNFVKTNRFSGFIQYSNQKSWNGNEIYYNMGLRGQYWTISGTGVEKVSQSILSPRAQFALKPRWQRDMLFRISGGVYQQPPFYRELRDQNGTINPNVKAQKSIHLVLGSEYSFTVWDRPFTLVGETYYKALSNVNPYTLEDVRIRYAANNNAEAYVYGAELRMNGAFVPGTESWLSLGYLKTEENIDGRGYISRPTDQRLKVGILFQDYVPNIPDLKMYLNLIYNTGVPGGSPNYADPYLFQNRLRDYRRADLGISYIFVDSNKRYPKNHWLYRFKALSLGFEIFNLFNTQNSITNTWVRDVDSKQQFAVPNFLTSRVLNLRVGARF